MERITCTTHPVLYLAGPMRGHHKLNYPMFYSVSDELRKQGFRVLNPASHKDVPGKFAEMANRMLDGEELAPDEMRLCLDVFMRRDVAWVCQASAVAVLPGWRNSVGAKIETDVARLLGMPIVEALTLVPVEETILQEAQRICYGDRNKAYGHPYDDYKRTVSLFNVLTGRDLSVQEGSKFMLCVKLSREQHAHSRDNLVDLCGYASVLDRIIEEEGQRSA